MGVYVTYKAKRYNIDCQGYIILNYVGVPKTKAEIDYIIKTISETETMTSVIPLTFYEIDDENNQ